MFAVSTAALILAAVPSMLGIHMPLVSQVQQSPEVVIASQYHTSAIAAIAAVGTTVVVILHVSQVHASLASLSRAAVYLHIIYEITLHNKYKNSPSPILRCRRSADL